MKKLIGGPLIQPFLTEVKDLYLRMDNAYSRVANAHGFFCNGCKSNCCETWFFHHTIAEYFFIMEGCKNLGNDELKKARERAKIVIKNAETFHKTTEAFKTMCPLNVDGKCIIYAHRPMICRLHGVGYSFVMPNNLSKQGKGCSAFEQRAAANKSDAMLDRTPFYRDMAKIEQELRQAVNFTQKTKMTVAQMLTF